MYEKTARGKLRKSTCILPAKTRVKSSIFTPYNGSLLTADIVDPVIFEINYPNTPFQMVHRIEQSFSFLKTTEKCVSRCRSTSRYQ